MKKTFFNDKASTKKFFLTCVSKDTIKKVKKKKERKKESRETAHWMQDTVCKLYIW